MGRWEQVSECFYLLSMGFLLEIAFAQNLQAGPFPGSLEILRDEERFLSLGNHEPSADAQSAHW